MTNIKELGEKTNEISRSKGFTPPTRDNFGEKIALVHSELSEALEAHGKDLMDDKLPNRHGIEVELADAIIRIADISYSLGLDIDGAIIEKLEYNKTRPYRHGKKF